MVSLMVGVIIVGDPQSTSSTYLKFNRYFRLRYVFHFEI